MSALLRCSLLRIMAIIVAAVLSAAITADAIALGALSYCSFAMPYSLGVGNVRNSCHSIASLPAKSSSGLDEYDSIQASRRRVLWQILSTASCCSWAQAESQIDAATGQLYSPRRAMMQGGGSDEARGVPLKSAVSTRKKRNPAGTGLIQKVYEARFIAYLSRFLLVMDPAANAWWKKENSLSATSSSVSPEEKFAEFAESVEVGLADYFTGPYGSYASVAAAKAGISAQEPAKSTSLNSAADVRKRLRESQRLRNVEKRMARQGVLNLFSLLKARYTTLEQKQQLALLFSMISDPSLQPVTEIRGLLGEVDNGSVGKIEISEVLPEGTNREAITATLRGGKDDFRFSSREGGGYSKEETQVVQVESPAPLGDNYRAASVRAIMKPTSRILRIKVVDGGKGYTIAPEVIVKQKGSLILRPCEAYAVIDIQGSVSDVIVVNPGFGYGGNIREGIDPIPPLVEIKPAKSQKVKDTKKKISPAKAVAELEYKITGVQILDGGSGYLLDEPPVVSIHLPEVDPDWFVAPTIGGVNKEDSDNQRITASVSLMKDGTSDIVVDTTAVRRGQASVIIGADVLQSIKTNPIELLPLYIRPQFTKFPTDDSLGFTDRGYYYIPSLPEVNSMEVLQSSFHRSIDPLFGAIGKAPVIKNALTLSADQYYRLALSGAICTVLVRTALNPLELVKTKIQLKTDDEIIALASEKCREKKEKGGMIRDSSSDEFHTKTSSISKPPVIGTTQVIQSLVEVRGPLSVFQSADITFLTSVVFGLFGFGATELFRRSFSSIFFDEAETTNELVLLAAAGFATLLTCAIGAPFEFLRVRSMSLVEAKDVREIFLNFVKQNRLKHQSIHPSSSESWESTMVPTMSALEFRDVRPLWISFFPIVSRELPFAVTKFLVFDLAAGSIADWVNSSNILGDGNSVRVGVGTLGLLLSAFAGALAGLAGALVSHPADLLLTLLSASSKAGGGEDSQEKDWKAIVKDLLSAEGGLLNLFAGFPARGVFFFLVIGLQFFLYDYIKTLLDVGTDDLTLVLDVFYAVRSGLQ